ncbi:hypothetical protein NUW58_g1797 [Xylaria curta]|uniref:Uncharacterized protein n=1 Tax=Xylaria curta TaxID=42375 RepID=A0ACC1PIK8_9PEZI|nr:hypothetical protein NUW58_g1797 [Xylaria curta]
MHFPTSSIIPTEGSTNGNIIHATVAESSNLAVPQNTMSGPREPGLGPPKKSDKSEESVQPLSPRLWTPAYLEKRRLVVFPILFLSSIVAIQVLIHISQSNDGLATPNGNLHYLWTFGPMAVLTIIAAFWARVEFQIKSVAPWAHMVEGGPSGKTLLLDYLSMLQPVVIVKAVKFRDWPVATASLCSIVLRVAIILSTALIALNTTEVQDANVPVATRSSFVDSATKLSEIAPRLGTLPYYSMRGLSERNISFPDGTWNNYAYQQFEPTDVPDAQLKITVEGFTSGLSCEPASLNTSYSRCDDIDAAGYCWALETDHCQFPIQRILVGQGIGRSSDRPPSYYGEVALSGCNNSTDVENVVIYMILGKFESNNGTGPTGSSTISHSAQIVCRASYTIDQIDVISKHTGVVSVSNSTIGPSRQIDDLKGGTMLDVYLQSSETATSTRDMRVTYPLVGETGETEDADLDLHFTDALVFSQATNLSASSLLNESFLEEILSHHYQQSTVFIAKSVLSIQTTRNITGTLLLKRVRLLVSAASGHTITALLFVATLLSISVILTKPGLTSLPKNPNSVIETAQLLANSKEALNLLLGGGPASLSTIKNRVRDFQFKLTTFESDSASQSSTELLQIHASSAQEPHELHYLNAPAKTMKAPLILNPLSIVGVQCLIVGAIVALEIILRISGEEHDFVDVSDQQYLHFAWTILPALLMSLISIYFAAVDSEIRSLTPYSKLSTGSSLSHMINLDLLDALTPRLLWREYRSESPAALSTTLCMLTASLLTIFVGSLYNVVALPIDTPIQLQTVSSFNITRDVASDSGVTDLGQLADFSSLTSTLILESNLSYPAFTYESLAFPEFSIIDTPQNLGISASDIINTTVPALRSKMSCTRYSSSEIQMEVISSRTPGVPLSRGSTRETLAINIDGEENMSRTIPNGLTHNVMIPLDQRPDADWVFGFGDTCKGTVEPIWCTSDFLYVWGHKTNSTNQAGNPVAALVCNETIEAVDVFTTFLGPQLSIDPLSPPLPTLT